MSQKLTPRQNDKPWTLEQHDDMARADRFNRRNAFGTLIGGLAMGALIVARLLGWNPPEAERFLFGYLTGMTLIIVAPTSLLRTERWVFLARDERYCHIRHISACAGLFGALLGCWMIDSLPAMTNRAAALLVMECSAAFSQLTWAWLELKPET